MYGCTVSTAERRTEQTQTTFKERICLLGGYIYMNEKNCSKTPNHWQYIKKPSNILLLVSLCICNIIYSPQCSACLFTKHGLMYRTESAVTVIRSFQDSDLFWFLSTKVCSDSWGSAQNVEWVKKKTKKNNLSLKMCQIKIFSLLNLVTPEWLVSVLYSFIAATWFPNYNSILRVFKQTSKIDLTIWKCAVFCWRSQRQWTGVTSAYGALQNCEWPGFPLLPCSPGTGNRQPTCAEHLPQ